MHSRHPREKLLENKNELCMRSQPAGLARAGFFIASTREKPQGVLTKNTCRALDTPVQDVAEAIKIKFYKCTVRFEPGSQPARQKACRCLRKRHGLEQPAYGAFSGAAYLLAKAARCRVSKRSSGWQYANNGTLFAKCSKKAPSARRGFFIILKKQRVIRPSAF